MGAFVELLEERKVCPPVWLDSRRYAERLLSGGAASWLDVGSVVARQRRAAGLFKTDVTTLPAEPVIEAWLSASPALDEALRARRRTSYPLKVLLADEALREHMVELTRGLRASLGGVLALTMPAPGRWVSDLFRRAHAEDVDVGADEIDSASIYVADFLRAFGDTGLDVVLLEDVPESRPPGLEEVSACQAVFNVARHYRWDAGYRFASRCASGGPVPDGLTFTVSPGEPALGLPHGRVLPAAFWTGEPPASANADFYFLEIPEDEQPERVLEKLSNLA